MSIHKQCFEVTMRLLTVALVPVYKSALTLHLNYSLKQILYTSRTNAYDVDERCLELIQSTSSVTKSRGSERHSLSVDVCVDVHWLNGACCCGWHRLLATPRLHRLSINQSTRLSINNWPARCRRPSWIVMAISDAGTIWAYNIFKYGNLRRQAWGSSRVVERIVTNLGFLGFYKILKSPKSLNFSFKGFS